jgi:hypothetical protein
MTRPQHNDRRHAPRQELTRDDLADIARLLTEIASLHNRLTAERLRTANLEAAIRAALSAHSDGEEDFLSYLRDEIDYPDGTHDT